jgi:hypothetical protein
MVPLLIAAGLALALSTTTPLLRANPACPDAWRPTPAKAPGPVKFARLGDLPKANLVLPVLRTVQGCPAPTVVRYEVEGDGRFAKATGPR